MATITKTGKETEASYSSGTFYASTWTLEYTCPNITISNSDVAVAVNPSLTAKYVGTNKGYGSAQAAFFLVANNVILWWGQNDSVNRSKYTVFNRDYGTMASGTKYSVSIPSSYKTAIKPTAEELTSIFGESTTRSVNIVAKTNINVGSSNSNGWSNIGTWETASTSSDFFNPDTSVTLGTIATLTLDAPPQVTLGTPTYSMPYAGLGTYTVPLTTLTTQYGGNITSVTLTVGADSTTQTYSTSTVSNQTISVIPSITGTHTPTLTVIDSRGQTTIETLPQITVNSYNIPSVSFDAYRTNDVGIKNDEGHYALIQSAISYTDEAATLTEPSIQIDGVDLSRITDASVTWYKTWNNTSGVSNVINDWTTLVPQNHMVTIYGLIDWDYDTTGNFAEDTSYQITLVAKDSVNGRSTPITQTMSTAFYTIDFKAGGKEIAFGAPANEDLTDVNGKDYSNEGLFKCRMNTWFEQDLNVDKIINCKDAIISNLIGEIKIYAGATVPNGWLECDGHEELIEDYPLLAAALSADHPDPNDPDYVAPLWGAPSAYTKFKLPDFKGQVPVGYDSSNTLFNAVGKPGGQKDAIVPYHNHSVSAITGGIPSTGSEHTHTLSNATGVWRYTGASTNISSGSSTQRTTSTISVNSSGAHTHNFPSHNTNYTPSADNKTNANYQPFKVIKYIICAA